jgi:hypothetical protein
LWKLIKFLFSLIFTFLIIKQANELDKYHELN